MTSPANSTPIPPGIEMPDEVRTRLGTLRSFDGVPDDETTRTLFDNLDFQRAVQAYLLAQHPVSWAAWRRGLLRWGPANTTMALWEDLCHPCTVGPAMHTTVVYFYMWIDLHDGPLVLDAPPDVYGLIDDSWGRWVVDIGATGPDKGQGGKYLFLPPAYDGEVPDGYFVVRSRSYGMCLVSRGFRDEHGDPHPAADMIKAKTRAYPLAQADDPPPMRFVNVSFEPWVTIPAADYQYWELLNEVVQSELPESSDPVTLGMFAAVGIQHGKPFDPDERMRAILTEAAAVGDATARALLYRVRQPEARYYPDGAWRVFLFAGYQFQDNGAAMLDTAAALGFIGSGSSPAYLTEMVGAGSQYVTAFVDATDAHFDGGRTYRLHVPPNVPVNTFWSIVVYDTQTRSMLQTDQEWPTVASDRDMISNADGSVDVHFGPERPEGSRNWIQTLPGKSWFAIVRLYGPLEPWFDKTWRLPDIEPLA
ncbi:DUF1254 domain-containing protein [Rhodococcus aetherivorans]|uniref:DUF1254 domain-containing protein n=1 Tax=Rhodococcus aetherivorans TaxID=191292 RepID=N1MIG9_9NOCA|nr:MULTISPECIES: DUF1254 domain-containing protein [Rhodococcus]KDE12900.1 signal peptide protein [Rhodococcus aetherivorans]PND51958.1 DUF1254 domain-containing protein [Rhodococcus sp. ENV425]QIX50963.1 DUF1254 domain-containing protein [Rhodococcus sp. DMU1]UGQ43409.1 DUF1254 domain-containing protein [Rhodococcus aetherivorans]UYF96613.1 DUF1254 domain-containing protein [Rhodococcus aetherivorans]